MRDVTQRRLKKLLAGSESCWVYVVLLLAANLAVAWAFDGLKIPFAAYGDHSYLARLHEAGWRLLPLLALGSLVLLRWRQLQWQELGGGRSLRGLILAPVVIFAWKFSTYDYNLFLDQGHYQERMLLLLLAALVYVHPGFIVPFLASLHLTLEQFTRLDALAYSMTDKSMPLQFLLLFAALLLLRGLCRVPHQVFVVVTLGLVGGAYFAAGWAKLALPGGPLAWLLENRLDNLFVSSHVNGWLVSMSDETVFAIAAVLRHADLLLNVLTLATELAGLFFLFSRRWAIGLLLVMVGMHVAIVAASGIFFWKWIVVDLAIAAYLVKGPRDVLSRAFNRRNGFICALIVLLQPWLFAFTALGWYDSAVNQHYEFEVVGESGRRYDVGRNFFAPFDISFAQNRHPYLNERPRLVGTYGSMMDVGPFRDVEHGGRDAAIQWLSAEKLPADPARSAELDRFLQRFFGTLNRRGDKTHALSLFAAPIHIYSQAPRESRYRMQEPVCEVRVRYVETYYDGRSVETLRNEVVRSVEVP